MLFDEAIGEFYEIIVPGAFAEAVNDDVTCNIDHDDHDLLGRTPNTLTLADDDQGLFFDCVLPETAAGQKAFVHVGRGDITKCSFAFDVLDEEWDVTEDNLPLRKLLKVRLYDTAAVIRPAYDFETGLSVRSRDMAKAKLTPPVPEPVGVKDPHANRKRLIDLLLKM